VDPLPLGLEAIAKGAEFAGVGNYGGEAVGLEQLAEEFELRRQVLLGRMLVDDGDAHERLIASHQAPLLAEHVDEGLLDAQCLGLVGMRHEQPGIQQAAAGIGVDLDELRPAGRQVNVVAEENAACRQRPLCRGRRPGQDALLEGRHRHHRFDGRDQFGHRRQRGGRDMDLGGREQRGVRLGQRREIELAAGLQRDFQGLPVKHGHSCWQRN